MKQLVLLLLSCFVSGLVFSQEVEKDLIIDVVKAEQYAKERSFEKRTSRGGELLLTLPFFDDFATYSLPTSNPEIPVELQRWSDDDVRLNCTFPILPPTIGVATFDGLDETGYPYNFVISDAYGPADTLTSLPIDLEGFSEGDNIYLTFFYQGGGIGNAPDPQDSLVLEFFSPLGDETAWFRQWSIPGSQMETFEQVFIPVTENIFLQNGFKFRFRNYASLGGNVDHWNLDYVFMNNNINPDAFDFFEVAFVDCPNTMLQDYTSMPWTHFLVNPSQFMATTVNTTQRNLSANQADNVTSGYKIEYEGMEWDFENAFSQVVVSPLEVFDTDYAVNSTPNDFVFDETVNDTCATFDVSFYQDNIGILISEKIGVPDNDSIVFKQEFSNYYAYDDGSAERAYALNTAGGQVAVKYSVATPDTLLGLFIHFTPFLDDVSPETFLMRIWGDGGGVPGSELASNFEFKSPGFYTAGNDVFGYYEYDEPLEVDGVIYVGFVQNGSDELNIGLDKNTNSNATRLFYKLGIGAQWLQSGIQGSVMIRPVFKSGKSFVWNSIDENDEIEANIYPVPASDFLTIAPETFYKENYSISLIDMNGRVVLEKSNLFGTNQLSISELAEGLYILVMRNRNGEAILRRRVLKQNNP
ncbi:MAG: hypothetical protein ACJAU0_000076 [Flavobacteriales bacterium]|jgi:hypothetical protein